MVGSSRFGDLLKDGMSRVFRIQEPMVSSALVFLVAVGLSYTVYQDKLGEMSGSRFDEIDDLFADEEYEEEGEVEEVVAEAPAAPALTAKPGTASAPAPVKKVRSTRKGKKPKPKMTENGLEFFESDLYTDDWAKGPEDAPVTIVKYADFECSYCRYMDLNAATGEKIRRQGPAGS